MSVSKLIKQLQELLEKEGDLPVYIFRRDGHCEDAYEDELNDDDLLFREEETNNYYKQFIPKRIQVS